VSALLAGHKPVCDEFLRLLDDELPGSTPDRDKLLSLGRHSGLPVELAQTVLTARATPRRDLARLIKERSESLVQTGVQLRVPPGLTARPRRPSDIPLSRRRVGRIKVNPTSERRKKQLGDEAENWALAAVIERMLGLDAQTRNAQITAILSFLEDYFQGEAVDTARNHALDAQESDLDPRGPDRAPDGFPACFSS
jgi:hypothetical protein